MTTFRLKVEFATDPPWTQSPTWIDITTFTDCVSSGVKISRGRKDEFSSAIPATCSLTLDNSDGRFTDSNASSPYYPNLHRGNWLRITETESQFPNQSYIRFLGYIDAWPLQVMGQDNQVQITASDFLKNCGASRNLRANLVEENCVNPLEAMWPMTENPLSVPGTVVSSGTGLWGDVSGAATADYMRIQFVGTVTQSNLTFADSNNTLGFEVEGCFTVKNNTSSNYAYPYTTFSSSIGAGTGDYAVEFWFQTGSASVGLLQLDNGTNSLIAYLDAGGLFNVRRVVDSTGSVLGSATASGGPWNAGGWHVAQVKVSSAGGRLDVYIDGVQRVTNYTGTTWDSNYTTLSLGFNHYASTTTVFNGSLGMVPVGQVTASWDAANTYTTALGFTRQGVRWSLGTTAFSAETAYTRGMRLLNYISTNIAAYWYDPLHSGTFSVNLFIQPIAGQSILSVLQAVTDTENGSLRTNPGGLICLAGHRERNSVSSAFTLSFEDVDKSTTSPDNDAYTVNSLIGTRYYGLTQSLDNTASQAKYGAVYQQQYTFYPTTDTAVAANLVFRASLNADPKRRVILQCKGINTWGGTYFDSLLAMDISTKFTISNLPPTLSGMGTVYWCEGYDEVITLENHDLTIYTSAYNSSVNYGY